jgi:hypothetical protein
MLQSATAETGQDTARAETEPFIMGIYEISS